MRKRSSSGATARENDRSQTRCKPVKVLPQVDAKDYRLNLAIKPDDDASESEMTLKSLSLDEVKSFPKYSIKSSIPCQNEPPAARPGVATWSGVRLRDLVEDLVREFPNDMERMENGGQLIFECLDNKTTTSSKDTITFDQAVDPKFEALLAYEADGEEITPSHGYPIRVVAPQLPGRKNVKWLSKIVFSPSQNCSKI